MKRCPSCDTEVSDVVAFCKQGAPAVSFEELDDDQVPETDIVFECPHCGKSLSIDPRGAGIVIACTQCSRPVTVPIPDGMDVSAVDSAPRRSSARPAVSEPSTEPSPPSEHAVQYRVPFGEAVRRWFVAVRQSGFRGRGREARSEYWWGYVFLTVLNCGLGTSSFGILAACCAGGGGIRALGHICALLLAYVGTIHAIRRAHDVGRSGWWLLVPVYGFVLLLLPSQRSANRFGPVPNTIPVASPRPWIVFARIVLLVAAILYTVFSAKTAATGSRRIAVAINGQSIARMVALENMDRTRQGVRSLWSMSGAETADDYFSGLREAGVDWLPDDGAGWNIVVGPDTAPDSIPFLVSANLNLSAEDLAAYQLRAPKDFSDRLDPSVPPFGRDAVCVVSRAGEVRLLTAADGSATDSALFDFQPESVVQRLSVLPAGPESPSVARRLSSGGSNSLTNAPAAKDGIEEVEDAESEGETESDEVAVSGGNKLEDDPASDSGTGASEESAVVKELVDGYFLFVEPVETYADKDPIRLAKKFVRALSNEDVEAFASFFVDPTTARRMSSSGKFDLYYRFRRAFARTNGFDPQVASVKSFDFFDSSTISTDDARLFMTSPVIEDSVDRTKMLRDMARGTLACVVIGFTKEEEEFHILPLILLRNADASWSLFRGYAREMQKTPEEIYREMAEKEFLAECATFRDISEIGNIDDALREKLIGQLLFRDICRTNGVPDEALKQSFASGGLDIDDLAKSIKSRDLFLGRMNALEKCLDLAGVGGWKRNELKIRGCLHLLKGPRSVGMRRSFVDWDDTATERAGKDEAILEVLALEAREIVRILASICPPRGILPDEATTDGTPADSRDYAERIVSRAGLDGIAAAWIREMGNWGIAWDAPSNAPASTPTLVSPGFPCNELAADGTRMREEVDIGVPFVIVQLDGSIVKQLPRKAERRHLCDMGDSFSEMLSLRYLTPEGVARPKGNRHWEEARNWNWDRDAAALGTGFVEARAAFAQLGGFPILGPPVEGIGFSGDFQRDVPLAAKFPRFETADLEYSHGAMVAFTLKARFPANIKQSAIDGEFKRVKAEFAKRMEALEKKNGKVKFGVLRSGSDGTGPIVSDLAWPVEVKIGSGNPLCISTEFNLRWERDGSEIEMAVDARNISWILESALASARTEDGDDLPPLGDQVASSTDADDLPALDGDSETALEKPSASPELVRGFKRMSKALEALRAAPSAANMTAVESVWESLPESGKAELRIPVWSASCAWLLSNGNKSAIIEFRKSKLDWDAFWPSVSDVCSRCKGSGRVGTDKKCFKCLGSGRIVSDGAEGKCMAVFDRSIVDALRICNGVK